jgi:hypothetical protein
MFHELLSQDRADGDAIPQNAGKDAHIRGRSHAEAWFMKHPGSVEPVCPFLWQVSYDRWSTDTAV